MRLFVAIGASDINFNPKIELKKLRVNLDKKGVDYRWVPLENYHVTLSFLGETTAEKIEPLGQMLEKLAHEHIFFHLKIQGLGVFPSVKDGRVVWMDIQNSMALRALQEECEKRLETLGFEPDAKVFTPHLTIARLRSPKNMADLISPLVNHKFGEMAVKHLTLYESKLGGSFPIYEPLMKFPLRERESQSEG